MRKVFSIILTLSLSGIMPSVGMANQGVACENAFTATSPGILISTGMFSQQDLSNPANQAAAVLNLLKMTTYTTSESFSKKLTLEKGELYLGQLLSSGWSLEYEYASDKRMDNVVYRLSKISIVKPNGEKSVFEKRPTTIDGLGFTKNHYSPEDLGIKDPNENPFTDVQAVQAPTVIKGDLLKAFLKFAPLAQYLKKDEITAADNLRALFLKGFGRSNADFMKGVIKKQAFKYALLGIVLYGYYSQQDLVKGWIHPAKDPWAEIKEKTDPAVMMGIISKYLGLGKKSDGGTSSAPVKASGSQASVDETLQQVASAMRNETTAGGAAKIFILDEKGAKSVSVDQLLGGNKNLSSTADGALLVSLPSSHRMMLLQVGENKQVITYGLDNVTSPNEYGAVKWALDHASE